MTNENEALTMEYASTVADFLPETIMRRELAERWEKAKKTIRNQAGTQTFNAFFNTLRFHGITQYGVAIFTAPTRFTAGKKDGYINALLEKHIMPQMGNFEIFLDDRITKTAKERMAWDKRYFAKYLAENTQKPKFAQEARLDDDICF